MFILRFITILLGITYIFADALPAELDGILTNAERLARGLKPATPRALEPKEINSATRTLKRGPACPSASPIVFPGELPIPTTLVAFEDDNAFQIELPFPVQIFQSSDHNVWVSTNGFVYLFETDLNLGANPVNHPLPSDKGPSTSVFAYWADIVFGRPDQLIAYGFDDKTVTLCFNGQAYADRSLVEFSITYTTDSPGRWYVYFKDNQWLNGESATIGAQDGDAFVQYEYSTAGTVYPGMRLAIDTNCGGSWTIG